MRDRHTERMNDCETDYNCDSDNRDTERLRRETQRKRVRAESSLIRGQSRRRPGREFAGRASHER